jgi:transposase
MTSIYFYELFLDQMSKRLTIFVDRFFDIFSSRIKALQHAPRRMYIRAIKLWCDAIYDPTRWRTFYNNYQMVIKYAFFETINTDGVAAARQQSRTKSYSWVV